MCFSDKLKNKYNELFIKLYNIFIKGLWQEHFITMMRVTSLENIGNKEAADKVRKEFIAKCEAVETEKNNEKVEDDVFKSLKLISGK